MATIYYKRLFRLRLLLEYYLQDNIHQDVFAPGNPDLESLLNQRISDNQYNIWKDLALVPTEASVALLNNRYIRFIPTPDGFFIGIKVSPDNSRFVPFIPLNDDFRFCFALILKNPIFRNIINGSLQSSVPAIYYLSNSNQDNNQVFPFLSTPVANFQAGKTYAMGDLAVIGGTLKEALVKTTSSAPANWKEVNATGLAHDGDRKLLPKQFFYRFSSDTNVTSADFALKAQDGTVIKQLSFSSSDRLTQERLDFSMNNSGEISDGMYQLSVTGSGGYQEERKVYLSSELYNSGYFGLIDIRPGSADFRLLEADGSIRDPAPVFEIRLKSRSTYWRYNSSEGKKLKVTAKTDPFLTALGDGTLLTDAPRPLSFMPVEFRKNDPAIERVYLPNPPNAYFKPETDGRVYSDIYLSPIKGLIEEDV